MKLIPRANPDWSAAAEVLIEGCAHLPGEEARVRWLEQLCLSMGDALYPAFLQVLCRIGEHGDAPAQKAVADTLVLALQSGRLPSGRHAAWGASGGSTATRAMGPIEYLCAWHAQPDQRGPLPANAFDRAARAVLGLISHSEAAKQLYCAKLLADADDPLDGSWSRGTRTALRTMTRAWTDGAPGQPGAAQAVDAFLQALKQHRAPHAIPPSTSWIPPMPLR